MAVPAHLRSDALEIWRAGVSAVDSETLMQQALTICGTTLQVCEHKVDLTVTNRIGVVGAGKAGAGMATAVERIFTAAGFADRLHGCVNVPSDCVRTLKSIQLHVGRPAGVNEPTLAGVSGSDQILKTVADLEPQDACLVLLSGGGSALLPAPHPSISLFDKQRVTQLLMQRGATIDELNCVRKRLSRIKGGGLGRASQAGYNAALIISDVIGDPLDVIASGPTVTNPDPPQAALDVLERYQLDSSTVPPSVIDLLHSQLQTVPSTDRFHFANHVIGNNQVAVLAACDHALRLGYTVHNLGSANRGVAREVGQDLSSRARQLRDSGAQPTCLISGGEPVVQLARTERPRKGGRNQELVLAALHACWTDSLDNIVVLSGGTDGEDGPTDAAGAFVDAEIMSRAKHLQLDPAAALAINDSYHFFESCEGLLKTGPTHTNVMDVRVVLVAP
ncbi:MAG: DUF4147 domain-containing protein [Planctomycetaceae bacterium]